MSVSSVLKWFSSGFKSELSWPMSASRSIALPDASGTLMLEGPVGANGAVPVRGFPPIVTVTSSKAFAMSDGGTRQVCSNSSGIVLTIPLNTTVPLPLGTVIQVDRIAQLVTVTPAAGVSIDQDGIPTSGSFDVLQSVELVKTGSDSWSIKKPGERPVAIVLLLAGESNIGGNVAVSTLPSTELQPSGWIEIWNNGTNAFQPLQIGTNNLIGHTGLTDNATAGLELGLARAQSTIGLNKIYLIKCGHGGSTIAQWSVGNPSNYWSLLVSRYSQAKATLQSQGFSVQPVLVWWLGLNDAGSATTPAAWQAATQSLFSEARLLLGADCPIHPIRLQTNAPNSAQRIALNTAIDSIAATVPNIFPISLPSSAEQQIDGSHFTRQGYVSAMNAVIESALVNRSFKGLVTRGARPGPPGNSPRVVAVCETALTLAHNVMTAIPFSSTASVDRDGLIDFTLNAIRIPSWGAGEYHVFAIGGCTVACTRVQVMVRINGVDWFSSPLSLHGSNVVFSDQAAGATLFLVAGDLVTLHVLQVNTTSATRTLLTTPLYLRAQIHLTRFST